MTNNLMTTTKSGRANQRDKAFSVSEEKKTGKRKQGRPTEKVDEPCRNFKQGRCRWGTNCRFTHGTEAASVNSVHTGHVQDQGDGAAPNYPDYDDYEAATFSVSTGATVETIQTANAAVKSRGQVTDLNTQRQTFPKGESVDSYGRPIIDDSNDGSFMGFKDVLFDFASSAFS